MKKFFGSVVVCLMALNANAFKLEGNFTQGGLLALSYDASITQNITINGKKVELSKDGFQYYPVLRNAKKLTVKQTLNNGTISQKTYQVKSQEYKVQHIKGVKKKHVTPQKPEHLARIRKESAEIRASRTTKNEKYFNTLLPEFKKPTVGRITGVFGSSRTYNGVEKSWHKGYDIANKQGTPIVAPLKGKVVLAMRDSFYNGNLVIVDHGKKIYTIYAHMYDIMVNNGDMLDEGDVIGLIGSTGRSTGPHLHWGVYVGQTAIDPELLLKEKYTTKQAKK